MRFINIILLTFILCNDAIATEFFIPVATSVFVEIVDEIEQDYHINHSNAFTVELIQDEAIPSTSCNHLAFYQMVIDNTLADTYQDINIHDTESNKEFSKIYKDVMANYYSISGNINIAGSLLGGLQLGLTSGYERYMQTGFIDLGTSLANAALMTGSAYIGKNACVNTVSFLSANTGLLAGSVQLVGAFGDALGGIAAGSLFALGAYSFGQMENIEARRVIAKSVVGSIGGGGASLLLGSGFALGATSLGTLLVPYIVAIGTTYSVNILFKSMDKQEEHERLTRVLSRY